ncbi:immunoglobulin lambda-1 light chain-like [Pungitius pungitius]|uniref:immunoglobulin lambda-1 light chain-like n=1 Tax=Pungitius pungitius TaxID=134920 RepID=UPI002E15AE23
MHAVLSLPAAALCALCSALVAMAAQLTQEDLTLTRRKTNGNTYKGYNHPQEDDFTAVNKGGRWDLEIQKVKPSHSASYYCSCWFDYNYYYIFGSGTKLYVTGEEVVKPVVSVYPAASSANLEGRSSLLCLASSMFPPLVRFSWKRQKENGPLVEMLPAEAEQLELTESGRTAAILLVHQQENSRYRYRCCVHHEGGRVEAQTEQEVRVPPSGPGPSPYQVKLLCRLYVGLIVKSLVFCCGVSLVMVLRNTAHM